MATDLILPSEIPWEQIKGKDLEELLYWLFDSMGAKDIEWRIGGKGAGTADQGRDLELAFFSPSPDGTLARQIWWVEAKGRHATVEPAEVHEAVLNAAGKQHIDVLVVATNTNFSNPTRDWVKEWQRNNPRPIVKLWERTELENLCSKNPLAVIRLHKEALSPQGKVAVVTTKLWDYASFSDRPLLRAIWDARTEIYIDERSLFALIASEFANGDIGARSWTSLVSNEVIVANLCNGLLNFLYLAFRANEYGVRQEPLIRAISFLILISIQNIGTNATAELLSNAWDGVEGREYPMKVRELILEPVLETLRAEIKDVCAKDCYRIMTDPELLQESEIEVYWHRLKPDLVTERTEKEILTIEAQEKPCKVGFDVGKDTGCPLFNIKNPHKEIEKFVNVVDKITKFRLTDEKDL